MHLLLTAAIVALVAQQSVAPPVTQNKKDGEHEKDDNAVDAENMPYYRYLKEVVDTLESDSEFREKLDKAKEIDIRTGKIAHELQYVNHKIRTKLDELKRQELERLRHLVTKENHLNNGLDFDHLKIADHIDHSNTRTFEINDLKKLIAKTTKDLQEADRKRREEFKEYEMQKHFEEEQKMKGNTGMTEEERKKYEQELQAMKEKHKKHQPLHHPGSKQQLEEVWEKQDHMESQEFDPKTFFYLHDVDGNGLWDQNEVKALFLKELDKLYAEGAPEDDVVERAEEMERMREHVFNEADLNKDGFISYEEFLEQTKKPDFQQDQGWEGLDNQKIYSQQEYEAFRQEEMQKMIAQGMLPPHQDNIPVHHEQFPPQYAHVPPQHLPQQEHIQQQQYQQQVPHHGQVPVQQQYQGHMPQQQYQPHIPQQQQYQGHAPQQQQYQMHGNNVQNPQYQGQQIPQQQHQPEHHNQQFQAHNSPQAQQQGVQDRPPQQQSKVPQEQNVQQNNPNKSSQQIEQNRPAAQGPAQQQQIQHNAIPVVNKV